MGPRLRSLVRLIFEGFPPGVGDCSGILLGGLLLTGALPAFGADAVVEPAPVSATDAVVMDAAITAAPESTSRAPGAAPEETDDAGSSGGSHWAMAPIRWGGTMSGTYQRRRSSSAGTTSESDQQIYELRLRANTYLVQPWIAQVSSDLGLSFIRSASQDDGSPASSNLRGTAVTGSAALHVFPQSRFPFRASLSLSDSRTEGALTSTDYESRRVSLRQNYRPAVGSWWTFGQYDRSEISGSFGDDIVDRLSGGFNANTPKHSIGVDGSTSRATRSGGLQTADLIGIARDTYRHSDALTVSSMTTYTASRFDATSGENESSTQFRTFQASTFGSWTPSNSPWRGTGNLRYSRFMRESTGSASRVSALGGSSSLSYIFSPNLNLYGTASVDTIDSDGERSATASEGLGLNYSATPLTFGNYSYNWYGSANVGSVQSDEANAFSTGATLGHGLQRYWTLSPETSATASFTQTLGTNRASGESSTSSTILTHLASFSVRTMPSDRLTGYLGVTYSDSRTRNEGDSSFQLLNVQVNGTWRSGPYSQLGANLTWQKARQSNSFGGASSFGGSADSSSSDQSLSGSINFSHNRLFGVRDLRYTLRYTANSFQTDTRQQGNPDAPLDRIGQDLDQRLYYQIGRLRTELTLRVAEIDGKENALLFFKVSRDFGAF